MYVTHAELAESPGAEELGQVASAEHLGVVDAALMDATLRAADRSAWEADEIAAADLALQRIDNAVSEGDAIINGYLVQRGYALPLELPPSSTGKSVLTAWSRAVARYLLHKNRISDESKDPVARDYRDALKMLKLLVEGKYSLGVGDPEKAASTASTDVRFTNDENVFSRDQLKAFR